MPSSARDEENRLLKQEVARLQAKNNSLEKALDDAIGILNRIRKTLKSFTNLRKMKGKGYDYKAENQLLRGHLEATSADVVKLEERCAEFFKEREDLVSTRYQ
jgi:uncharacterized protein YicC (UPF0701 family)